MMKMNSCLLGVTLALSGCTMPLPDKHVMYKEETPDGFPKLTATGFAIIDKQPGKNRDEQLIHAMRASKLDAYRELAEQVHGTQISATSQVSDWKVSAENMVVSVKGVVKGAKVLKSYAVDNHYITEVSLDYQTIWHLKQNQKPRKIIAEVEYF